MSGWVGGWMDKRTAVSALGSGGVGNGKEEMEGRPRLFIWRTTSSRGRERTSGGENLWMGGWVGWVEENEAVGMSYCELGVRWVGGKQGVGMGGWVGGLYLSSRCVKTAEE